MDLFITTDRGWKFGRGDLITAGSCPPSPGSSDTTPTGTERGACDCQGRVDGQVSRDSATGTKVPGPCVFYLSVLTDGFVQASLSTGAG